MKRPFPHPFYARHAHRRQGIHPRTLYVGDELTFELCNIGIMHRLRVINLGGRQFTAGDDVVHFKLLFSPPIPCGDLQGNGHLLRRAALRVCRNGNLHDPCLFMHMCPLGRYDLETLHMPDETHREFWAFPTHHLEIDTQRMAVTCMYLVLENNQLSYDDMAPQIEPHIDAMAYIASVYGDDRVETLPWYPLDTHDSALEGVPVSRIQQRTPVWFDLRPGKTSGSGAGKEAAGFFVERNEEEKEDYLNLSVSEQVKKLVFKRTAMRLGRIREDDVVIIFLHNFPHCTFEEAGYMDYPWPNVPNAPPNDVAEYVKHWGASPDGTMFDPHATWDNIDFPKDFLHAYTANVTNAANAALPPLDPRRAVLEFKCSYRSTKFPEYYLVQVYWEMMATNTCHGYLLRYKRRRGHAHDGVYKTLRSCHAYHFYRDPNVERVFIENVLYTVRMLQANPQLDLATLIRSNPRGRYSSCRTMCLKEAQKLVAMDMDIPEDVLEASDKLRWEMLRYAKQGATRLPTLTEVPIDKPKHKKTKYTVQTDAQGDPARRAALLALRERLNTLDTIPPVENNETARTRFLKLCQDQQETYRLLAEEMIKLAPDAADA